MEHWSGPHLAALAVTAGLAALLVLGARRGGDAWAVPAGRCLAVVILAGFVGEQLTYALRGEWSAEVNLPFQLTDAVTLVAILALWRPWLPLPVELVFFWALTASLQAVLTPDLDVTFPDPLYLTYFATHAGAVAAACLLVIGSRRTPRPGAAWRAYAVTAAFAVARRGRDRGDRRQLHVPPPQAGRPVAARPPRPVARVHRGRRGDRPGRLPRALRAGPDGPSARG